MNQENSYSYNKLLNRWFKESSPYPISFALGYDFPTPKLVPSSTLIMLEPRRHHQTSLLSTEKEHFLVFISNATIIAHAPTSDI